MLRGVVAVCLVGLCVGLDLEAEWSRFKLDYSRHYREGLEETLRKRTFADNLAYIEQHNAEADKGLHTYRLGVGPFADMSHEEFKATVLGLKFNADAPRDREGEMYVPSGLKTQDLPATVDWRTKGYVTAVKNQKQCGSCWAFSTTGSLEGQHFKKTGQLVSLSEQNLVDCSKKEGNMGCEGGLMDQAFKYIKINNGIDTEQSYPYLGFKLWCRYKSRDVGATLSSWVDVPKGNETALQDAVAAVGPISVAIDASHRSFQLYRSGVYNEEQCSSKQLDHGVLAVGYGAASGTDYWLVKNSWGAEWGMEGYIQMSRNKDNQCGIATSASYPVV